MKKISYEKLIEYKNIEQVLEGENENFDFKVLKCKKEYFIELDEEFFGPGSAEDLIDFLATELIKERQLNFLKFCQLENLVNAWGDCG